MTIRIFEVQTKMFDGWENCWTDDGENPIYFKNKKDAQKELNRYLLEIKQAVKAGDMVECYPTSDFRIRETLKD